MTLEQPWWVIEGAGGRRRLGHCMPWKQNQMKHTPQSLLILLPGGTLHRCLSSLWKSKKVPSGLSHSVLSVRLSFPVWQDSFQVWRAEVQIWGLSPPTEPQVEVP